MQFLWFYTPSTHKLSRIVHAVPVLHGNIENTANYTQRAIESCGTVILAVASRPIGAVFLTDFGNVARIQLRPGLFEDNQDLLFVKFGAWFIVVIVFDFALAHFNDHFAFDGMTFVNRQSAVILQEIRKFEFGNAQHVRFEGPAN